MARNQIEIVTPQFRVPTLDAPMPSGSEAESLNKAAQQANRIYEVFDHKAREDGALAATHAATQWQLQKLDQITKDDEDGKIGDGYTGTVDDDLQTFVNDHSSEISNHYERQAFDAQMLDVQKSMHLHTTGLETKARQSRNLLGAADTIETATGIIAKDPSQFEAQFSKMQALVGTFRNPEMAEKLKPYLEKMGLTYARSVIANDPVAGLALMKSDKADQIGLDPANIPLLVDKAQTEIHQRESRLRYEADMARRENLESALDARQSALAVMLETGEAPTPEVLATIHAGSTNAQIAKFNSDLERKRIVHNAVGDVDRTPTSELYGRLETLYPTDKKDPHYDDKMQGYIDAKAKIDKSVTARNTDPAALVTASNPAVLAAWVAYDADPTPANKQAAIAKSLAAQELIQVAKPRVMSNARAKSLAATLNAAPAEKAAKMLKQESAAFGPKYWGKAIAQMGKDFTPAMQNAPRMDDPEAQAMLLEGSKIPLPDLRKQAGIIFDSGASSLSYRIATQPDVKQFMLSLRQREGGAAQITPMLEAIETLALTAKTKNNISEHSALKYAIDKIVREPYAILSSGGDVPYRIRRDMKLDPSQVESGATYMRSKVATNYGDRLMLPAPVEVGMSEKANRDLYLNDIRNEGYWVTNDDGSGAVLYVHGVNVLFQNGSAVEYKFSDLDGLGSAVKNYDPAKGPITLPSPIATPGQERAAKHKAASEPPNIVSPNPEPVVPKLTPPAKPKANKKKADLERELVPGIDYTPPTFGPDVEKYSDDILGGGMALSREPR